MDFTVRLPVLVPASPLWDDEIIESYYNEDFWGYNELLDVLRQFCEQNEERILRYNEKEDEYEYQFNEVSAKLISDADKQEDEMAENAP